MRILSLEAKEFREKRRKDMIKVVFTNGPFFPKHSRKRDLIHLYCEKNVKISPFFGTLADRTWKLHCFPFSIWSGFQR